MKLLPSIECACLMVLPSVTMSGLLLWSVPSVFFMDLSQYRIGNRGSTVVKVLSYKSEGSWFDPSWCHWNFSLT